MSHEPVKVLGRWQIDYCSVALHRKVLLNNEDHCGPCGSAARQEVDDMRFKDWPLHEL